MSERRFLIVETPLDEGAKGVVTESELKTRCEIVASILSGHSPGIRGWNEARDILLHGERKEQPQSDPTRCFCGKPYGHLAPCNSTILSQPDPWQEWVEKMPNPTFDFHQGSGINWLEWCDRMQAWFRTMPRGK